jgi:hypothetical protein
MFLRRGALLFALLMFSSFAFAAKRKTKAVYCTQAPNGTWSLQRFEPLINPRAGTIFAELSFAGPTLEGARLRRFYPNREVVFDYKFDGGGRLTALLGSVELWGQWLGEADLYPETDGKVGTVHVKYYRASSRDRISLPEDADEYTAELSGVPVYRTIESLPCSGSLHEAEKMNATQE